MCYVKYSKDYTVLIAKHIFAQVAKEDDEEKVYQDDLINQWPVYASRFPVDMQCKESSKTHTGVLYCCHKSCGKGCGHKPKEVPPEPGYGRKEP